jgi:hypothetical protein
MVFSAWTTAFGGGACGGGGCVPCSKTPDMDLELTLFWTVTVSPPEPHWLDNDQKWLSTFTTALYAQTSYRHGVNS